LARVALMDKEDESILRQRRAISLTDRLPGALKRRQIIVNRISRTFQGLAPVPREQQKRLVSCRKSNLELLLNVRDLPFIARQPAQAGGA